jgi:hypothetical protein
MDNTFRIKKIREPSKSKAQELVSGTLDSVHQTVISSIKESTINIEELRKRAEELEDEIEKTCEIYKVSKLQEELDAIKNRLDQEDPLTDYFVRNADLMIKYYSDADKKQAISATPGDQRTFMKFLAPSSCEIGNHSKKDLFEEYATRMKMTIASDGIEKINNSAEHCDMCNIAREEMSDEGVLVCPTCGSEAYMLVVSDLPSFRDPPKERNNYAYKKINHLNEILNQFQAKESTIIPEEVMLEVVCEIKKRRIRNIAELTEKDMREILKKLNRSKYYEHATHILSRLNGNPPPTITPEIEEKIRTMFQEIQAPFLLYCPDDRTNFLSYSYILYKFFELLELDEYKVYFPLLKSRDRLIAHDQIWEKICSYLRWEFIRSV